MKHQSGLKACQLQSNNDSKFMNKTMKQFCQLNSIIHETTILYLPEQNGIAEQGIIVFFEIIHCML